MKIVYLVNIVDAMATVSARIPDEIEIGLDAYIEADHFPRSTAVRKLLAERLGVCRRDGALAKLEAGEVTFSRAAEVTD